MPNLFAIRVQKLFLITLVLKVTSSFLGWYFQMQWSLGFAVPLLIMCIYIVLGYFRRDTDVSDEKFADTCYYLGFIFTITSLIFSLFDLPNIGTRINDIAVRFGAAMVSTVLGLGVRVYLVSFRKDVADAIKDAEDGVLDATRKFTQQLVIALDRLKDFETQVGDAAKTSVERVNVQVENLSRNHADKLTAFFADLTTRNQDAFSTALNEVKAASQRLADSVDGYSNGMRANLAGIDARIGAFTDAVTERLKTTTFPDDYFAQNLKAPLAELTASAAVMAEGIKAVSTEVTESSLVLSNALKQLRQKANATETSLDTVLKLTIQQQGVLTAAEGQLSALGTLTNTLSNFDKTLQGTIVGIGASNAATGELTSRVSAVVTEVAASSRNQGASMASLLGKLDATANVNASSMGKVDQAVTANTVAVSALEASIRASAINTKEVGASANTTLEASAIATNALIVKLGANASAAVLIANKLEGISLAEVQSSARLDALGAHASAAIAKVENAVGLLSAMVQQLGSLDIALRGQSSELKQVAGQIKDIRVVVEVPPVAQRELVGSTSMTNGNPSEYGLIADGKLDSAAPGPYESVSNQMYRTT